ncbi:hypothetical protein JCM10212_002736 [Sporobolomyces blumeae]
MSILFLLTPTPMPSTPVDFNPYATAFDVPRSPSQSSSFKSWEPSPQPHHRSYSSYSSSSCHSPTKPRRRIWLSCVKYILFGLTLSIVVWLFASRSFIIHGPVEPNKVATAASNLTLTEYIDSHFPPDLAEVDTPHLWITLADARFAATGAANHDVFFKQLNAERRAHYGKLNQRVRDSVIVTLCLDSACPAECMRRDMYCYEGFESRRPSEILPATWPKLASLIELLPNRDVFFVDADVAIRQDPYPVLEPLMEKHDVLAQENVAYDHFNTGFMWMRKSQVMADAWAEVLRMDMQETSRDQFNLNTVLATSENRLQPGAETGDGKLLYDEFVADNGLRVHVLDQRLFRIMHVMELMPWYERHDALVHHTTCADDAPSKLFVAKALGYWSDVDEYYTKPPPLVSIDALSATERDATQLFKLLLAVGHYTDRAVLPPAFVTVTDLPAAQPKAVQGPAAYPVAHLEIAFNVTVLEPKYIRHAQGHLLGQSTLDPKKAREDPAWTRMSRRAKKAREDIAVALTKTSEIDLRRYITFASLVERLQEPDLGTSRHVELVNADQSPFWQWWKFDELPLRYLRPCEQMTAPWDCGEMCRGVDEIKRGPIREEWLPVDEITW